MQVIHKQPLAAPKAAQLRRNGLELRIKTKGIVDINISPTQISNPVTFLREIRRETELSIVKLKRCQARRDLSDYQKRAGEFIDRIKANLALWEKEQTKYVRLHDLEAPANPRRSVVLQDKNRGFQAYLSRASSIELQSNPPPNPRLRRVQERSRKAGPDRFGRTFSAQHSAHQSRNLSQR